MILRLDHPDYPPALRDLSDPPDPLWAVGDLDLLKRPCVAIVGTRQATPYGERVTRELGRTLARAGACVISGLARGVDAEAHRGALEVGGATCAVLGTGVEVVYPRGHAALQAQIADKGLVLSEQEPANRAYKSSFPKRNRIIAALAKVTIVVEAGFKSGALHTAREAEELGRTVAVVPGPIDMPQSQGSNAWLRDGIQVITSMGDAIALMGLTAPIRLADLPAGGAERKLWDALGKGPADLDTLCARCALPAHEAMAGVTGLEIRGLVECELTGEIRRV